jgi:hypothetical protein
MPNPLTRIVASLLKSSGVMLALLLLTGGVAVAGKPIIDESYANGEVVYMIGPHLITNPNPKAFAQAEELYIVAYPINGIPPTDTTPKSLPGSGYVPQCNPCYHFGPPSQGDAFAYHDHILSGSPGFGRDGTAGTFKGPWRIILLMYNASVLDDPDFKPAMSAEELDAREEAACSRKSISIPMRKILRNRIARDSHLPARLLARLGDDVAHRPRLHGGVFVCARGYAP